MKHLAVSMLLKQHLHLHFRHTLQCTLIHRYGFIKKAAKHSDKRGYEEGDEQMAMKHATSHIV